MTPAYHDEWLTIYGGDVRDVLPSLPADSVDCIVTSPPYWGLRDYGTATWEGGDAECDHVQSRALKRDTNGGMRPAGEGTRGTQSSTASSVLLYKDTCGKCGATRIDSQLGLERTPEEYVANMVAVFRELRRVLKPSGTCWLNLGDSYAAGAGSGPQRLDELGERLGTGGGKKHSSRPSGRAPSAGLAQKQLVGIPWRVAFALQADGWYLRSDIIWSKPNPMPESVTDRPTKSHEYLFLLTKQPRYYFDADAVREEGMGRETFGNTGRKQAVNGDRNDGGRQDMTPSNGRNIRSVWTIATRPYPGAHFAVFPPELPERCIKAGSSEKGVCPECGAPWGRVVNKTTTFEGGSGKAGRSAADVNANGKWAGKQYGENIKLGPVVSVETLGWRPSCTHGRQHDAICATHVIPDAICTGVHPAVILDPFGGSGTVGMVANRLSRRAILIDLNPEYLRQQLTRNAQTPLGLTEGDAA